MCYITSIEFMLYRSNVLLFFQQCRVNKVASHTPSYPWQSLEHVTSLHLLSLMVSTVHSPWEEASAGHMQFRVGPIQCGISGYVYCEVGNLICMRYGSNISKNGQCSNCDQAVSHQSTITYSDHQCREVGQQLMGFHPQAMASGICDPWPV